MQSHPFAVPMPVAPNPAGEATVAHPGVDRPFPIIEDEDPERWDGLS